ncbi:MAG: hypothetical protein JOZ27_05610 [Caulobacteraceae bacterium]|nr:hypothetical protein [Caulobacteraceae bacterium]
MPFLIDYRHEAFAEFRARGETLDDAYELAGYERGRGHGARLAAKPEIAARIAELEAELKIERENLEAEREALCGADLKQTLLTMLRLAKASEMVGTPAALKEAAELAMAAHKLYVQWEKASNQ